MIPLIKSVFKHTNKGNIKEVLEVVTARIIPSVVKTLL